MSVRAEVAPTQVVTAYGHSVVVGQGSGMIELEYTPEGARVVGKIHGPSVGGVVHLTIPTPPNLIATLFLQNAEPKIFPDPNSEHGIVTAREIFFNGQLAKHGTPFHPGTGIGVTLTLSFPVGPVPREILITSVSVQLGLA
jgi:hypothetical protein